MTDRLYYTDSYLREFDALVVGIDERGGLTQVTLDRTAFYPTSGGQPFDIGSLGPLRVVDVIDQDDGTIAHVADRAAGEAGAQGAAAADAASPAVGDRVRGSIDWRRRFDHMQQHTEQHVLSAAFERLFGVRTVSFHLGAASSTIDLARVVSAREIAAAEDEANRVVWEDRSVSVRFESAEAAARLPLRKAPARTGTLRIIDVEDFDLSACGGTHVARTGAIGLIATASAERFKGGHRIEFLCGGRALDRFRTLRDATASAIRLLSVATDELPAGIERLQADAREQKRAFAGAQTELARYRAVELAASAEQTPAGRLVLRAIDADAQGLKTLAGAVAAEPGRLVVLTSTARPALVVVARSADLTIAANDLLASLVARFGGRGGGKADLAQGGGLDAPADDILSAVRSLIGS
jgi:alanyl-tRNA synthetase